MHKEEEKGVVYEIIPEDGYFSVRFTIGIQSFTLSSKCENEEHALTYIQNLKSALNNFLTSAIGKRRLGLYELRGLLNEYSKGNISLSRMQEIIHQTYS